MRTIIQFTITGIGYTHDTHRDGRYRAITGDLTREMGNQLCMPPGRTIFCERLEKDALGGERWAGCGFGGVFEGFHVRIQVQLLEALLRAKPTETKDGLVYDLGDIPVPPTQEWPADTNPATYKSVY